MGKFNANKVSALVTYEGGQAFNKSVEDEWLNLLMAWFVEPQVYRSDEETKLRFEKLTREMVKTHGCDIVAKCAIFARNELGMRSVSCLVASVLNEFAFPSKRSFYRQYFRRADDVMETFSCIDYMHAKKSHALVRAAADFLSSLDEYQLSKYRNEDAKYSMLDAVNITHAHSHAIDKLKRSTLPLAQTFENTAFNATTAEQKQEMWLDMLASGKLGTLALVRNLSNIVENCSDYFAENEDKLDEYVVKPLTNKAKIHKSLAFPYRFYTAYSMIKNEYETMHSCNSSKHKVACVVCNALQLAFSLAMANVPHLNGSTAVVVDASGSMLGYMSEKSCISYLDISSVYAATFVQMNPSSDVVAFASTAKLMNTNLFTEDPFSCADALIHTGTGYSTNLYAAVKVLEQQNKEYNRIVLFSDMQVMTSYSMYSTSMQSYLRKHPNCMLYSFDVTGGYATQVAESSKIKCISALNDNAFKFMQLAEYEKSVLDYIDSAVDLQGRQ